MIWHDVNKNDYERYRNFSDGQPTEERTRKSKVSGLMVGLNIDKVHITKLCRDTPTPGKAAAEERK